MRADGYLAERVVDCNTKAGSPLCSRCRHSAEFWEINGISPEGRFGPMAAEMSITQAFANDFGHDLAKNVAKGVIGELYEKTPAFVRIAPHVRGVVILWRNHLRAQRRCKDVALELAQGACAQMDSGQHFAWEWPMDLKYGRDCEATKLIFDRSRALGVYLSTTSWSTAAPTTRVPSHMENNGVSSPRFAGGADAVLATRSVQQSRAVVWLCRRRCVRTPSNVFFGNFVAKAGLFVNSTGRS